MARPRKNSTEPGARERIIEAFWELLAQMPYSEITVSALIRCANVAPNTLYYHFTSYDEVVQTALDETLDPRIFTLIIGGDQVGSEHLPKDIQPRFNRVVLFASDQSGKLPALLRASLKRVWIEEMLLDQRELMPFENAELDFVFAGVVSLLAGILTENGKMGQRAIHELFERPLGKGILGTLEALQNKKAAL
jgi:AcrR family transcriptional regulator